MILTMRIEKITQSKQPQVVFLCFDDETKLRVRASVVMDYGLPAWSWTKGSWRT